jgi:hypothetical protein
LEALQRRYSKASEGILDCKTFDEYRFLVGGLRAYEDMATLPDTVIVTEEVLREQSRTADARNRAADAERASTRYASTWFARP